MAHEPIYYDGYLHSRRRHGEHPRVIRLVLTRVWVLMAEINAATMYQAGHYAWPDLPHPRERVRL